MIDRKKLMLAYAVALMTDGDPSHRPPPDSAVQGLSEQLDSIVILFDNIHLPASATLPPLAHVFRHWVDLLMPFVVALTTPPTSFV